MSIWSIDALKEYIDARFAESEKAVDRAAASAQIAADKTLALNQRAIDKAEAAVERRLEGMNEFRAQLAEERGQYVTADVYSQRHRALEAKVDAVDDRLVLRISIIEKWQAKIIGALALTMFLIPGVTSVIFYLLTRK